MNQTNYLRWFDAVCQALEEQHIAINAEQIEAIFRPQFDLQRTPKQAISACWQEIHQYRLTKF